MSHNGQLIVFFSFVLSVVVLVYTWRALWVPRKLTAERWGPAAHGSFGLPFHFLGRGDGWIRITAIND